MVHSIYQKDNQINELLDANKVEAGLILNNTTCRLTAIKLAPTRRC